MTVLVTGAGGLLGRHMLDALRARGLPARGSGRGDAPTGMIGDWRRADLLSGAGLSGAVAGVTAVVHCATDPLMPDQDIRAIEMLIEAVRPGGAEIVHVGVAGIEDAASALPYYRAKLACEQRLLDSRVPRTICRATQFHPFVDHILGRLGWGPLQLRPPMTLQPVDPGFVAQRLVDHAVDGARGRVADLHGPDALDTTALLGPWLQAHRHHCIRVPIPAVGPLAALARLRRVSGDVGGVSWREWLSAKPARAADRGRRGFATQIGSGSVHSATDAQADERHRLGLARGGLSR